MLHSGIDFDSPMRGTNSGVIQFTLYLTQLPLKVTVIYVKSLMKTRDNFSRFEMSSNGKSDVGLFAALDYPSILAIGVGGAHVHAHPFGYCQTKRKGKGHTGRRRLLNQEALRCGNITHALMCHGND